MEAQVGVIMWRVLTSVCADASVSVSARARVRISVQQTVINHSATQKQVESG